MLPTVKVIPAVSQASPLSQGEDAVAPWWANNPELDVVRSGGVLAWLDSGPGVPLTSDGPDPVVEDFFSGASWRELAEARDDPIVPAFAASDPRGVGLTRVERLNSS